MALSRLLPCPLSTAASLKGGVGSRVGFASLRSEKEIFALFREGYLLLACAHALVPTHKAAFVEAGERNEHQTIPPSDKPLHCFLPHSRPEWCVAVTRGLAARVKPTYRRPPCCSPLGRRAKLPQPPFFYCQGPPTGTSWQVATVQQGESQPAVPASCVCNRSL